jgi:hypothetical protein
MEDTEKKKREVLKGLEGLLQTLNRPEPGLPFPEVRSNMEWDTPFPSSLFNGILMTDVEGKAIGYNKKLLQMWKIPSSVIDSEEGNDILSCILEQLKEPKRFLQEVRECYSSPETKTCDRIELKDGKVLELFSGPQKTGGRSIGRIWTFHEIAGAPEASGRHGSRQKDGLTSRRPGICRAARFHREVFLTCAAVEWPPSGL